MSTTASGINAWKEQDVIDVPFMIRIFALLIISVVHVEVIRRMSFSRNLKRLGTLMLRMD